MHYRHLLAAAAALAASASAMAQSNSDIVVTGDQAPKPEAAKGFVNSVTRLSGGQIARFHDPVCPIVIGFPQQSAARIIERRIRLSAAAIGAAVARDERCEANLIVIIAESGHDIFEDIARRRPGWIDGLQPHEIKTLRDASGPVRSWAVTSIRNEDGRGVGIHGTDLQGATLQVRGSSYIKAATSQYIDGAVMVIDRSALDGKTLRQFADYAVMRGLARTRDAQSDSVATILSLFAPGASPAASLTPADQAYLRALYAGDGRNGGIQERGRIAAEVAKERP